MNGGLSRNRTSDTRIFSPLLYRLSYETTWLREKDLNQRPPGYEPDELPAALPRDIFLAWLEYHTGLEKSRVFLLHFLQILPRPEIGGAKEGIPGLRSRKTPAIPSWGFLFCRKSCIIYKTVSGHSCVVRSRCREQRKMPQSRIQNRENGRAAGRETAHIGRRESWNTPQTCSFPSARWR